MSTHYYVNKFNYQHHRINAKLSMSSNLGKHFKFVHYWKLYKDESTCLSVCRKAAATVYTDPESLLCHGNML